MKNQTTTTITNNMINHTFFLNGLSCANCAAKIEEKIKRDPTYTDASFSFATKKLQFKSVGDEKSLQLSLQKLVDQIEEGVTVDFTRSAQTHDCDEAFCSTEANITKNSNAKDQLSNRFEKIIKKHISLFFGFMILVLLIIFDLGSPFTLIAYVVSYLLIGHDVIRHALKNIIKGQVFDEYFLMTLATLGAFALHEYTEAVSVMLFYKIGEAFQDYAVDQSRRSIQSLLHIRAEYANKIIDGNTRRVLPEELDIDDLILVRAGEKVPVDGIIIDGDSSVDTSALTGETFPREVSKNDSLLSGCINQTAVLTVRVTKTYENSTVAKILDMVENATSKKAKTEQFITKFAKVYTPIVVISSLILALLPPLLGFGSFADWISRALIFLVISCPCALVLSVPLAYFAGLGNASRHGILIKGGNYLEALNTIDTYVFDKTGTLTTGKFVVNHFANNETLRLAAYIEQYSTHPLAKSILDAYTEVIPTDLITNVEEFPGKGIQGTYNGKTLLVGNERLMKEQNIQSPSIDWSGSVIHVSLDNKYIGHLEIGDQLKERVHALPTNLRQLGAKSIYLLSGDQDAIVSETSRTLGFDAYHSELLPGDKLSHVETYLSEGKHVLFVGDGINDAPVLARADIGVAMGGVGSDAAVEAADIILMTDEPGKILEAKKIAKYTRKIVLENIIFALGIKIFFLTLGAFGQASMYQAIFADVGVALLAVLNSMRITKLKL